MRVRRITTITDEFDITPGEGAYSQFPTLEAAIDCDRASTMEDPVEAVAFVHGGGGDYSVDVQIVPVGAGTPTSVLDLEIPENDSGETTVRGYLRALLLEVWREEEGFSGKRPFGNSGWQFDLTHPIVVAGLAKGGDDATVLVHKAIEAL